jgi:glycosyltransferase involved in cell wall biosynthesis
MRILYYSAHPHLRSDSPSGPSTHIREMIRAWQRAGHEVRVVIAGEVFGTAASAPAYGSGKPGLKNRIKSLVPKLLWETLKDIRLLRFDRKAGVTLRAAIDEFKPDFIYERGYYMLTSGVEQATIADIPILLEMNARYPEERVYMEGRSLLGGKALAREAEQMRKASGLVVVSSALEAEYLTEYPFLKGKILITPNAVNPGDIRPTAEEITKAKRTHNLPDDAVIVGFVGSIFPYHGVDKLLSGFEKLNTAVKTHLLIVGGGMIIKDLKESFAHLSDRVTFTGAVPYSEVYPLIANMDICVLPDSRDYCSPIKIFEYGALNKAVISIGTTAVRDVMIDGETGLLISNEQELIEAMKRLAENPALRTAIGEKFGQKVREQHTWDAMARLVLDTFADRMTRKKHG